MTDDTRRKALDAIPVTCVGCARELPGTMLDDPEAMRSRCSRCGDDAR